MIYLLFMYLYIFAQAFCKCKCTFKTKKCVEPKSGKEIESVQSRDLELDSLKLEVITYDDKCADRVHVVRHLNQLHLRYSFRCILTRTILLKYYVSGVAV